MVASGLGQLSWPRPSDRLGNPRLEIDLVSNVARVNRNLGQNDGWRSRFSKFFRVRRALMRQKFSVTQSRRSVPWALIPDNLAISGDQDLPPVPLRFTEDAASCRAFSVSVPSVSVLSTRVKS
jgi:hypothetical protein